MQYHAMSVAVPIIHFNTLPFFAPEEEFHPIGRPFAPCFKCRARTSFPLIHTLRFYRFSKRASRFLTALSYAFARSNFSAIIFRKSCLVSVCCRINSASFCFLISKSIFKSYKTKNPRVFNPRVLLKFEFNLL